MPTPILPVSSPDISTLSYSVLFDISGAIPNIVLTNASTVINSNHLIWWYVITTPSGTPIHTGSLSVPDVVNVPWTTLQITPNSWPMVFGMNGPCAQVEFSTGVPYICTLYVKDSASNTFSLTISQTVVRPNGNTQNSCGNFGVAAAGIEVKCYTNPAVVFCADSTNYTYNNILSPITNSMVNQWVLTYPPDANGNQPANGIASNTPSVTFPIGYNGSGYVLFLNDYAAYDMGNGATIKVQYKAINPQTGTQGLNFAVLCNIDLCRLQCQMSAFYEVSKKNCNTVDNSVYADKKTNINYLYAQAITGIIQPLCGIDVAAIVAEIQSIIGNIGSGCDCGCTDTGINFNYPTGQSASSSGCCPVSTGIIDNATGLTPTACPQSYFPVQVKDPTNTTVIGSANNINDLVSVLNATPSWEAYGVAFAEGNCKLGWFPATGATTIPNTRVNLVTVVIPPTAYKDPLIDINSSAAPAGCPTGNPYPLRIYDKTATTIIGIANNIGDVVAILNADAGWSAFGVASVQDTCNVQFNLTNPATIPPVVKVDSNTTSSSCTSNSGNYLIYMVDPCFPLAPITTSSFPCNFSVDWQTGSGVNPVGLMASFAALVAALNASGQKPPQLTFTLGTVPNSIQIANSDCTAYPHAPAITANSGSAKYMMFGANHTDNTGTGASQNGLAAFGLSSNLDLGRIPGATGNKHMWHTIHIGNYAIVAEGDTGKIYFYDISNPLTPTLARTIQLNDTGSGNCFTGLPHSTNFTSPTTPQPSFFSLYFPTDYYAGMSLNQIFVTEGTTGSVWVINFAGAGSGVVASDTNAKLLGKCPRIYAWAGGSGGVYLTQDGDLEQAAGLSSGVTVGAVVNIVFNAPSSFSYNETIIIPNVTERVWAGSYDGTSNVYWTGQFGSVAVSNGLGTPFIINTKIFGSTGQFNFRLNTSYFAGILHFAALQLTTSAGVLPIRMATGASLIAGTPAITGISLITSVFNIVPVGSCLIAITIAAPTLEIYRIDNSHLVSIPVTQSGGSIYNIISVPQGVYTPNSLINP